MIGLTDFHGQLERLRSPSTDEEIPVGGAAQLATLFDQEAAQLPSGSFLFASGDNVGASPANSGLLARQPGDRRRERVGARSDVLREPTNRLRRRRACRSTRPVRTSRSWARTSWTRRRSRTRAGSRARTSSATGPPDRRHRAHPQGDPRAGQRRCNRGPAVPRRGGDDQEGVRGAPGRQGVRIQVVLIHQGTAAGQNGWAARCVQVGS